MDVQPEVAMDLASTTTPKDSEVDLNNDIINTGDALLFPVGFNQDSLIKHTTCHELLLYDAKPRFEPLVLASGSGMQDKPINLSSLADVHLLPVPSLQYRWGNVPQDQPKGILGSSRLYKMKYKPHGIMHHNSIPYIRSQANERKLRLAASLSNIELVLRLLESGVNPNSSDDYQRSALHLASSRGYADVVAQLLKHGALPNQKDSLGNTPLHLAVCSASSFNFNMVVRILLKHGASVHTVDRNGKNPLDLVKSKLSLMRMRREKDQTPESAKMLMELSFLTSLLIHTYVQEEKSLDMNSLEERLQQLSTNEIENEADMLLAKVEQLTIKN